MPFLYRRRHISRTIYPSHATQTNTPTSWSTLCSECKYKCFDGIYCSLTMPPLSKVCVGVWWLDRYHWSSKSQDMTLKCLHRWTDWDLAGLDRCVWKMFHIKLQISSYCEIKIFRNLECSMLLIFEVLRNNKYFLIIRSLFEIIKIQENHFVSDFVTLLSTFLPPMGQQRDVLMICIKSDDRFRPYYIRLWY